MQNTKAGAALLKRSSGLFRVLGFFKRKSTLQVDTQPVPQNAAVARISYVYRAAEVRHTLGLVELKGTGSPTTKRSNHLLGDATGWRRIYAFKSQARELIQ